MHRLRTIAAASLATFTLLGTGCVGFSGPNDIRNQITSSQPVELEKEQGFSVGPLGFLVIGVVAGPWLPVDLDGLYSVDYGAYTVRPLSADPAGGRCLRGLELAGWEPVVRVRERGSDVLVMVNERGEKVTGLLFLVQDGRELQIVRARGDFEKILDNLMESDLLGDFDLDDMLATAAGHQDTPPDAPPGASPDMPSDLPPDVHPPPEAF